MNKFEKMTEYMKEDNEFVILDIETSHFHPDKGGRIIEIGAIKLRNNKIVDKYSQFINPELKISSTITELTGITNEMLANKRHFRAVLPEFFTFIGNCTIVAHNSIFDWDRFLLFYFSRIGLYPQNKVIDTMVLAIKLYPKKSLKLSSLCFDLGINVERAHRALNDALMTTELFLKLKKEILKDNQINLFAAKTNKEKKLEKRTVRYISFWEKNTKQKHYKRIYVTLDKGVVFFDIPSKAWEIKECICPIDFEQIEKDVLIFSKTKNMNELICRYA